MATNFLKPEAMINSFNSSNKPFTAQSAKKPPRHQSHLQGSSNNASSHRITSKDANLSLSYVSKNLQRDVTADYESEGNHQ